MKFKSTLIALGVLFSLESFAAGTQPLHDMTISFEAQSMDKVEAHICAADVAQRANPKEITQVCPVIGVQFQSYVPPGRTLVTTVISGLNFFSKAQQVGVKPEQARLLIATKYQNAVKLIIGSVDVLTLPTNKESKLSVAESLLFGITSQDHSAIVTVKPTFSNISDFDDINVPMVLLSRPSIVRMVLDIPATHELTMNDYIRASNIYYVTRKAKAGGWEELKKGLNNIDENSVDLQALLKAETVKEMRKMNSDKNFAAYAAITKLNLEDVEGRLPAVQPIAPVVFVNGAYGSSESQYFEYMYNRQVMHDAMSGLALAADAGVGLIEFLDDNLR